MKHIFVTGGVVSSLGKGLSAASLGALLESRGLRVRLQKFDPYLNVDPGTMNPEQHGEVYVLKDGAETDLDLGHYERFTHTVLTRKNSVTSGQIYASVINKERRGLFLGQTVQVIPHITDAIKAHIEEAAKDVDILITEIGGTTGDIEGLPFLEAMRQFNLEQAPGNVLFLHVTLIPFLRSSNELKTKPTQQSVARLREIGIQPQILLCRTEHPLGLELRQKISLFCNVSLRSVVECRDVEDSIYELPLNLHNEHLDSIVLSHLRMEAPPAEMGSWRELVHTIKNPEGKVRIGIVGKYMNVFDAYKSVYEALTHGALANKLALDLVCLDSEQIGIEDLEALDGIVIPGGFGERGIDGKIKAAEYARTHEKPLLGICLGMQVMAIEFARNVAGLENAHSTEFDPQTPHPVIDLMPDQRDQVDKGASMRLGAYSCLLQEGSLASKSYKTLEISERHRHRYEFNNAFSERLEKYGMMFSGVHSQKGLVEILELPKHPWYLGVQFHPEFQSRPTQPHPLFASFIGACYKCNAL